MVTEDADMTLKPIGFVRNGITQQPPAGWGEVVSEIVIDDSLVEALANLEEFSHIIVLSWMHRGAKDKVPVKVRPMGRKDAPLVGLLATRSPHRPNPIGKATVALLERRGNILSVRGLDVFDGTVILDIKPYIPGYDSASDARVPSWVTSR